MSVTTKLGIEGKLYRNTGTYSSPTWSEMKDVSDLTLSLESVEADVTTREGGGWGLSQGAIKNAGIEFKTVWDTGDSHFTALRDAWLNHTNVELLCLDGASTTAGSQGLRASFQVLKFNRTENNEEAMLGEVAVKPARSDNAPAWYTAV